MRRQRSRPNALAVGNAAAEPDTGEVEFTWEALHESGFVGFVRLSESKAAEVPQGPGVYVVYRSSTVRPVFLPENKAGLRDHTVPVEGLTGKWVEGAQVVYIGKAIRLRRRIGEYRRFGAGTADNHVGGCCVFQLADHADVLIAWRVTAAGESPEDTEKELIGQFKAQYRSRPFANHLG